MGHVQNPLPIKIHPVKFKNHILIKRRYININQSNGEAPPGPDLLPQAARGGHRSPVREVRRKVRHLRLVRPPVHPCQDLRRVQLRQLPGQVRDLRRAGRVGRVLLQGVHDPGEGPGRMPEDRQPGQREDGPVLRAEEVRIQEEITCSLKW